MRPATPPSPASRDAPPSAPRSSRFAPAVVSRDGTIVAASDAAARGVGRSLSRLVGASIFDLIHPDDVARAQAAWAALWRSGEAVAVRCRVRSPGRGWKEVDAAASLVSGASGRSQALISTAPPRPAKSRAGGRDAAVRTRSGPLIGAIDWDLEFNASSWSDGAARLFGYDADEMLGTHALQRLAAPGYRPRIAELRHRLLAQRCGVRHTSHVKTKDGRTIVCDWVHAPVFDDRGEPVGFTSSAQELTGTADPRTAIHARLRDPLTGMATSALFFDRTERAIAAARRARIDVAVFIVDLDHFAAVNREFGHRAGDGLLREVAERLCHAVREADSVARLGGDKFLVLVPAAGDEAGAAGVARRILDCFVEPFVVDSQRVVETASIGIAAFPADGADADALVRCADIALIRAKEIGRDVYQFYAAGGSGRDRPSLARELRRAVEHHELVAYFQPQVELRTGTVVGAEALVRWQHPKRGLLPPAEFVQLAEETGLIIPIGEWMLRSACTSLRAWRDAGVPVPRLTVNVSGRELRRRLVDDVAAVLCDLDVDPAMLELELTETVSIRSSQSQPHLLDELKSFGVRLAVDDFGVGYSSLAYLQRFPIDTLKIDRLFVGECLRSRADRAIVEAIVTMAHGLDLEVVAEGVETAEQADFLRSLDCDGAQGYLYSPPLPEDRFLELVAGGKLGPA